MKVAEQRKLIKDCISVLSTLNGVVLDKQWYAFKYLVKGSLNNCTITIPNAEKTANKGLFHIYCRFDNKCNSSGLNCKFNVFIEDIEDFRIHLDRIIDECYNDEEFKSQLVFDAVGKRDVSLFDELYF